MSFPGAKSSPPSALTGDTPSPPLLTYSTDHEKSVRGFFQSETPSSPQMKCSPPPPLICPHHLFPPSSRSLHTSAEGGSRKSPSSEVGEKPRGGNGSIEKGEIPRAVKINTRASFGKAEEAGQEANLTKTLKYYCSNTVFFSCFPP